MSAPTPADWTRAQVYMTERERAHEAALHEVRQRAEALAELLEILRDRGDLAGEYAQGAIDNARRIGA